MRSLLTGRGHALTLVAATLTALCLAPVPALADTPVPIPPPAKTTPKSVNGQLFSRVEVSGTGTSGGAGSRPITSSDVNWSPPVCWYESFTPDEFKAVIDQRYLTAGNNNEDTIYDFYYQVRSDMEGIHYHKGDDGRWWLLVYNADLPPDTAGSCSLQQEWMWVPAGDPPPPAAITPGMLAQVAYGATKLPVGEVVLSPGPADQKVNLATYVTFRQALPQVYVTASVPNPPVAATVVAEPYALHVDAGTTYAEPESCDYPFTKTGGTYTVDTSRADCNITYRKSTADAGSYPLAAQITWKVHWTASTDPNGPVAGTLADGYTTARQDVTVQEIQTVNR